MTRFARDVFLISVFAPQPVWLGRAAQMEAGSGPQLSERSEFCGPPPESSSAGCLERSGRTQTVGSPFLWVLSFGEAKVKCLACRGESRLVGKPKTSDEDELRPFDKLRTGQVQPERYTKYKRYRFSSYQRKQQKG